MAERTPGLPDKISWSRVALGALATIGAIALALGGVALGSSLLRSQNPPASPQPEPVAAPVRAESLAERIDRASTISEAVALMRPHLGDGSPTAADPGGEILAQWAARHLRWQDMANLTASSYALAQKDTDAERGKYICSTNRIVQIRAERGPSGTLYRGTMSLDGSMITYVAVGSTGKLVDESSARFCGVIAGRWNYRTLAGGTAESIFLIGMFDLPENRTLGAIAKPAGRP
jgi:hypothetical protein